MQSRRRCEVCEWRWVGVARDADRCPRCQSPRFRSRPSPFARREVYVPATPQRPALQVGWYTDPAQRFDARYWDGDRWTERVQVNRREAIDLNPTGLTDLWDHPVLQEALAAR